MDKRKVQKTGGSTYTISLPKGWAEEKLEFGDYVSIEKNNNYLKLFKEPEERQKKRASIKFDENSHTSFRKIVSLYLSGYDHINMISNEEFDSTDLEGIVQSNMVGMEVVKSDDSRIELKNLVRYEDLPFQQVLVRIDSLLKDIIDEIDQGMKKEGREIADKVSEKEQEVDRMYMLGVRQLKQAAKDPEKLEKLEIDSESECVSLRVVLKSLERIGDHLKKISEQVDQLRKIPDDYRSYFEEVEFCYRNSINALRKRDSARAEQAIQKSRSTPEIPSRDLEKDENLIYKELEKSLERVELLSDDIAEIVMNITIDARHQKELFRDKKD
jgi:phosphate uptake regulator